MKILVGISGGVDSAVCANRLISLGHDVSGAVLVMHEYTEIDEAREVCNSLGIPLFTVDCRERFELVKADFRNEYMNGRTPNPCVICNEKVKMRCLLDYALEHGFDMIATGHYASLSTNESTGRRCISVALDPRKDQSYMLYRLPEDILSHLVLPLGDSLKTGVREEALDAEIPVANRKDSQEICFLPDGGYADYVESIEGKSREGYFIDESGNVISPHKGIANYTVGQRKGLGVSLGERAFVTDIDPDSGNITLSTSDWGCTKLRVTSLVYQAYNPVSAMETYRLKVKLRYSAPLVDTVVTVYSDGRAELSFDSPVKAAPGQSAVFYDEGSIAFGGIIVK